MEGGGRNQVGLGSGLLKETLKAGGYDYGAGVCV